MSALVWLTIPVVALVLAMLWVAWASRTPPRADVHETVEAHRRFVAALDAHPAARRIPVDRRTPADGRTPVDPSPQLHDEAHHRSSA